ncbi:hypothetical protein HWQ46_03845 [Shewanella sp. D64]|uniref:hypothetical protein n=1 Tax=unclassified Shewanella TaxID=196818 RepID=UPI0022BA2170|nr:MULTISPECIES: hypothetical protein [unclassified Shewanella]MEC4724680.1 hypothetical protein [Shewanella sp. D64]MEC4736526.1 hypothetical protein [Shewanella sp. E94]WBJ97421.1 hypothetical protein HWQ47_10220 [Shewanella sp. MTB7]
MLAIKPTSSSSLDQLLLYHFLFVTAIALLILPLIIEDKIFELMLLLTLQITLTCISTLIGLSMGHRLNRGAMTLLFAIWMLVWCVNLA